MAARVLKGQTSQSEHSRKRQAFITGMSVYRMTAEEKALQRTYVEEWHYRIRENFMDASVNSIEGTEGVL